MCTSASTACRATSAGVWNSGPTSTSKPRSAKAVAITFWPRSWPSWPILATRMRGRRPSACSNASTSARVRSTIGRRPCLVSVHTGDRTDLAGVPPVDLLQRVGDLADGRLGAGRVDRQREQVALEPAAVTAAGSAAAVSARSASWQASSSRSARSRRSFSICWVRTEELSTLRTSICSSVSDAVLVDADDRLPAGVDPRLGAGRGLLDAQLRDARVDGLGHAAGRLDLLDVLPGPAGQVVGQPLDVGAAAPRVDDPGGAGLLLEQQLGVAGDAGGEVGRQRERLVEGVGVQRLGVALGGGHRLDAGADDVVEHVLRGQRPAGGLEWVRSDSDLGFFGSNCLTSLRPQQPGRPQLGDLHEEVHADRPEERQPRARTRRRPSPASSPARRYSTPSARV